MFPWKWRNHLQKTFFLVKVPFFYFFLGVYIAFQKRNHPRWDDSSKKWESVSFGLQEFRMYKKLQEIETPPPHAHTFTFPEDQQNKNREASVFRVQGLF